jgi:cell division protein FtsI/penicillin-binding protein 2
MYAPSDNPKYSMVVISPNVSHKNGTSDYFAYINRYISKRVSDYLFTNY